jgi:hypothetical protein
MQSKTPPTGPRSENGNMLGMRTRADLRTSPSRLGHSYKPRKGGSTKCGAKRVAICVCVSNTDERMLRRFGYAASLAQRDGSELVQPGDLGSLLEEH